jgi:Flp pilus assembly pilin Flp
MKKMNKKIKLAKASAVIDYTLLIVTVASTLLVMGAFLQRGISGKWKDMADVFGKGRQNRGEIIFPGGGGGGGWSW